MSGRRFSILIALMSLSLVGIIALQIHWIWDANDVHKQQFDTQVNDALRSSILAMEEMEAINLFKYQFKGQQRGKTDAEHDVPTSRISVKRRIGEGWEEQEVDAVFQIRTNDLSSNDPLTLADSAVAAKWEAIVPQLKEAGDNSERVLLRVEHLHNVMERLAAQDAFVSSPLNSRLDSNIIRGTLSRQLVDRGIDLPFQFAVRKARTGEVSGELCSNELSAEIAQTPYRARLFPHDVVVKGDELLLYFPKQGGFFFRSMWIMLALSVLFTLVIITAFGGSLFYMIQQKKNSDIKSDFINNMTHEFKTPIATISLAIDSLAHPQIAENKEKLGFYKNVIRQENKRMNKLVENLLQISLLDKGDFSVKQEQVQMHELMAETVMAMQLQAEEKGGNIEFLPQAENDRILGDDVHLRNVVSNLLDNAIKYSPHVPQIRIATRESNKHFIFEVVDNGTGMNVAQQKKVFEKFYRVPTGDIHNVQGFGLGLSYVKAIVNSHKGEIMLESSLGNGTTVTIQLPKAKSEEQNEQN